MILVTVGMHSEGFERLVRELDRIAFKTGEEVVMQIGATPYEPQAARWFRFTSQAEIELLVEQAHIVVSHAGAGSILTVMRLGKRLIVMPRLKQYGEVVDDHQFELADALARQGALLVANDGDELLACIRQADEMKPLLPERGRLLNAVRRAVLGEVEAAF